MSYDMKEIIEEGNSEEEVLENFLGDSQDLQDPDFLEERFHFIADIIHDINTRFDIDEYPYAVELERMIPDNWWSGDTHTDLHFMAQSLSNKSFRDAAKGLLGESATGEEGAPAEIYGLLVDNSLLEKFGRTRASKLIKQGERRKLQIMFDQYCENLSSYQYIDELYGMAKALGIKNPHRKQKEWLCKEIGTRILILNTGMHPQNLKEILE